MTRKGTIGHFGGNVQIAVHLLRDIHVPYPPHSSKPYSAGPCILDKISHWIYHLRIYSPSQ